MAPSLLPEPPADDGYDVSDYYSIDPAVGTLGQFVEFVRTARDQGIRVVIDLVVNHTSDEHPWFQAARRSRDSLYRDWYVRADEPPEDHQKVIFPDREDSNWAYDERAEQYYLHRFYSSEPDLNVANPDVRDEVNRIMGFRLELGVSGFRVDAAPYLIGGTGIESEMPQDPHSILENDELNLSRVPEEYKETVMEVFAPEESMRIYGRGIRRRLPPMVAGDRRRIELTFSLLLTLPGTPVLLYGEEIGMGDDLGLEGRQSVRTVMQWSARHNAGFSTADADQLRRPAIHEGPSASSEPLPLDRPTFRLPPYSYRWLRARAAGSRHPR